VSDKIFIDTLFVVALVSINDQYHKKATELAAAYEGQPLLVTDAVLLEIGNGLARHYKRQAIEIIDQFLASEEVEIVNLTLELFKRGFSLYKRQKDKDWGLVDCISFEVMREKRLSAALTFDLHFVQAGFQALMREDNT